MDGAGRLRRRKSLHERLGLKSMVCCGSTWGFGASAMSTQVENEDDDENDVVASVNQQINIIIQNDVVESVHQQIIENDVVNSDPECPRMNLAAALAAERQLRSTAVDEMLMMTTPSTAEDGTPVRISLMRLLEETETDGLQDVEKEEMGRDQVCCVCMGRKKGAALIPCGHTFCRVCCRELWLNRGTCPLCNRSILEILDIY